MSLLKICPLTTTLSLALGFQISVFTIDSVTHTSQSKVSFPGSPFQLSSMEYRRFHTASAEKGESGHRTIKKRIIIKYTQFQMWLELCNNVIKITQLELWNSITLNNTALGIFCSLSRFCTLRQLISLYRALKAS